MGSFLTAEMKTIFWYWQSPQCTVIGHTKHKIKKLAEGFMKKIVVQFLLDFLLLISIVSNRFGYYKRVNRLCGK